jgi:hypothetical protein
VLAHVGRLVQDGPDATLVELCTQLHAQQGLPVSVPTKARIVKHLGLPRKKKSLQASERDT